MNFNALDRMLRRYTKEETIQKKTGVIWISPTDTETKKLVQTYYKSGTHLPSYPLLASSPQHFALSKQSRFAAVPEHSHSWFEIQYIYSGCCEEVVNNVSIQLTEGQLLCLDTDVLHSVGAAGENDIIINLLIHKDYCKKYLSNPFARDDAVTDFFASLLSDRISHNRYLLINETPELHFFMLYLMCQYYSPDITSEMVYENTISLILAEITKISETEAFMGVSFANENTALILKYISGNFRTCTLQSVAAFFKISPSYLTKLIKTQTGMTYKQLVQHLKLTCAENLLLNTAMPVETVCHEAGYENQSYFYKLFLQKYGCTPKEYREGYENNRRC